MTPFEHAFAIVVGHEGGYDATCADPGNWTGGAVGQGELRGTKYGVSAAAYPNVDIANLTETQAQAIYKPDYWDRVQGDALPPPLALLVFDAAVNTGVGRAARWLQGAVGATADGQIGAGTLAALNEAVAKQGGAALCAEFMAQRLNFMANLPTWRTFGLGWARRLCALPYESLTMTAAG
jgi:lysozyme family protein